MAIEPVSWRIARDLLTCFCAELAQNANDDPTVPMPQRCCLRGGVDIPLMINTEGLIASDQCCLGEAYVKIVRSYQGFPEPEIAAIPVNCQMGRITEELEIGIIRCLSVDGDCAENSEALRIGMADKEAAFRALCCWRKSFKNTPGMDRNTKYVVGAWERGGPDGGCLTGVMPVYVSVPGFGCC